MNVLVYSDEGASAESTAQVKASLRRLLSDRYAVSVVTAKQLITEPWQNYTALLVFPGGADLPYCRALNGQGNKRIKDYVKKGGAYLGLCAGGYYGAENVEFEKGTALEVSGPRELGFVPGVARGAVYKGFKYGTNLGSTAAPVLVPSLDMALKLFLNGGCVFDLSGPKSQFSSDPDTEILASYEGEIECECSGTPAAIVYRRVGKGNVVLSGVHVEYDVSKADHESDLDPAVRKDLLQFDKERLEVARSLLRRLGLEVAGADEQSVPQLTPLLLTSVPENINPYLTTTSVLEALGNVSILEDANDTFEFTVPDRMITEPKDKVIITFSPGVFPPARLTPYFNHTLYYDTLVAEYSACFEHSPTVAKLGAAMLYGEVVTSTSTMVEKNPVMVRQLPHGTILVGTQQIAGRGRGSNVWVNPIGVLAVSGVLRVKTTELRYPLVFVQYLTSLAVLEAVKSFGKGYEELGLALKWPNDIYIRQDDPNSEQPYTKIGGVLVSCHVVNGEYVLLFGSGTNVDNPRPTTSINSSIRQFNSRHPDRTPLKTISLEALLGKFMARFGTMFEVYCTRGFEPFEYRYYSAWLHDNASVTLERHGNVRANIRGISPENGMLVAEAVDESGQVRRYELQPDGNSFDMFRGLIRKKI